MAVNLTPGAITKISSGKCSPTDLKPVVQVLNIHKLNGNGNTDGEKKERYFVEFSDGLISVGGMIASHLSELVTSNQLQKGSVVQLNEFVCTTLRHAIVVVIKVHVILTKCDIIGDPKPYSHKKTSSNEKPTSLVDTGLYNPKEDHADVDSKQPLTSEQKCSQTQSTKRKRQSSNQKILAAAKDIPKSARLMMEKNTDDMGACFEKLENIGWGTEDPLYDIALSLFGESVDYMAGSKTPKSNDHNSQSKFHPIKIMAANLTPGAITKISNGECSPADIKPVVQVLNIHKRSDIKPVNVSDGEKKERYFFELSDGSVSVGGMIFAQFNDLVTSNQLQKGSVVQLNEFVCTTLRGRAIVVVIDVHVILTKCDIIGDPKPYSHKKTSSNEKPTSLVDTGLSNPKEDHADVDPKQPLTSEQKCSQTARMMMEKNKEDDMGACFEKLENFGWGTEDPLYDTALLLFGESAEYRKLWLLLKPESCGKWVKNAGSKFGLLG